MKKRTLILGLFALLGTACIHHSSQVRHPHGMPPGQAKKIGHAHGHGCGHKQHDGAWVVVKATKPDHK